MIEEAILDFDIRKSEVLQVLSRRDTSALEAYLFKQLKSKEYHESTEAFELMKLLSHMSEVKMLVDDLHLNLTDTLSTSRAFEIISMWLPDASLN